MQREILFRGKSKKTGKWIYGSFDDNWRHINQYWIYELKNRKIEGHEVEIETVGQYTGLEDRNGNKIFEGDIVKQLGGHKPTVVEFFNSAWRLNRLYILGTEIKSSILEIIGNIHTNKELITQ